MVLGVDPLALFVDSRPVIDHRYCERENRAKLFPTRDVPADTPVGGFLLSLRKALNLSLSDVSRFAAQPPACFGISPGFLSQVETNFRSQSQVISGEKLWALGVVLSVDPLALFVLSRNIGRELHLGEKRDALFFRFSI